MPELPDIELYIQCLKNRVENHAFSEFKTLNPFVLRTVTPPKSQFLSVEIINVFRMGKRICFEFSNGACLVIHLMISGRLRWIANDRGFPRKITHAYWIFENGTLIFTEASSKKRAGIWLFDSSDAAHVLDRGGIDVLTVTPLDFEQALRRGNRTLKRALTDPSLFSGIGNAYSDEILFYSGLSPLQLTLQLNDEEVLRLYNSCRSTLNSWSQKLLLQFDNGKKFPEPGDVTAFRPEFATHGKFKQPCPVCEKPIQRIVYAENETNYCAVCQNKGRILADRSLSRLLKNDWPRQFNDEE